MPSLCICFLDFASSTLLAPAHALSKSALHCIALHGYRVYQSSIVCLAQNARLLVRLVHALHLGSSSVV